ncbi:hypothetical protein [Paenibacillus sp. PL2-23]|uniref:hypothetical protein n=1 Tax=Paenibacillus sp. PL2-23 TaxID=2100729 RepID=UPI0030FB71CE
MSKCGILAAALLATALLAGCSGETGSSDNSAGGAPMQTGGARQQAGGEGGPPGMGGGGGFGMTDDHGNVASLIGQVKSINGNVVTVYKSALEPGAMGGGMGGMRREGGGSRQGGQATGQDGQGEGQIGGGETAEQNGQDGALSGGGTPPAAQEGDAMPGEAGQGRPVGGMSMFTEETVDVTVTDTTAIQGSSFGENGVALTDMGIADLKEGDILTIWLVEGSEDASLIRLGGMGGAMGGGRGAMDGQPRQQAQGN